MNQLCQDHYLQQSKLFFEFEIEDKIYSLEDIINASIDLLQNIPSMRITVLKFLNKLFHEYCYQYCLINTSYKNLKVEKPNPSSVLMKFIRALNSNALNRIQEKKKSTDSNDCVEINEDCPQSPPKEPVDNYEMEDLTLGNHVLQNDLLLMLNLMDKQMVKLSETLTVLLKQDQNSVNISISDWALDLAIEISYKHHAFIDMESDQSTILKLENLSLVKSLSFWKQCFAMQVLTNIIFDSIDKIEATTLISRILKFSPHSDWILANLFTNMSHSQYLTQYIEQLINNSTLYSTIYILSHVSEHNPYAIVNCSKSNIPFLLKLCTNSKPLLDLLAHDIVKKVDVQTLNKLAESHTLDEFNFNILFCILNAPNAFELLKISFDLVVHPKSSEKLVNRILNLLTLLVKQLHQFVYESVPSSRKDTHSLLVILRDNIHKLICHPSINRNATLKRIQVKLISLTSIYYGREFITEVFHHLMNVPQHYINTSNYQNPKINNQIMVFLNSLRIHLGFDVQNCIKETLELPHTKKLSFWSNFMTFIESKPMELKFSNLIDYLNQKSIEDVENIFKTYYILRIFMKVFNEYKNLYLRQQYRLCYAIVTIYFELLNIMKNYSDQYLTVIMDCLVICQNFLKNLAQNFPLNEYIIGRCLLDFIREKNYLFLKQYSNNDCSIHSTTMNNNGHCTSLLSKNMHNNFKLKKNPLVPFYIVNKKQCCENKSAILNRQLLIDLLKDCIHNKSLFAENFVNSLSDELLLRDAPLLEEDPKDGQVQHIRMTFETDLYIYRLFDENPVLWNILEFSSKNQCLKHCLVIIRCIINVLRTNLFSSTPNEKNTLITKRFISLLANDEILPRIPFIYIPETVPDKVKPNEMAYVLHDIARYIRNNQESPSNEIFVIKSYLNRLRIILAHKKPDEVYLKIFKNLL